MTEGAGVVLGVYFKFYHVVYVIYVSSHTYDHTSEVYFFNKLLLLLTIVVHFIYN